MFKIKEYSLSKYKKAFFLAKFYMYLQKELFGLIWHFTLDALVQSSPLYMSTEYKCETNEIWRKGTAKIKRSTAPPCSSLF